MAILTDEWERKILNHIFVGGSTYRIGPSTKYLGVSTQAFTESDTAAQAIAKEPGTSGTTYNNNCLLYTSPSPRDGLLSRMPSSA